MISFYSRTSRKKMRGQRFSSPEDAAEAFKNHVLKVFRSEWKKCWRILSKTIKSKINIRIFMIRPEIYRTTLVWICLWIWIWIVNKQLHHKRNITLVVCNRKFLKITLQFEMGLTDLKETWHSSWRTSTELKFKI